MLIALAGNTLSDSVGGDWASDGWLGPIYQLSERAALDLELLCTGAFEGLPGFLGAADYTRVLREQRLAGSGKLWPIPVVLDVPEECAAVLSAGALLKLRDPAGLPRALVEVTELYRPDRNAEAQAVYGTTDPEHVGVRMLLERTHPVYVGARVLHYQAAAHYDFLDLRYSPAQARELFRVRGWERIVAFQTRNPMHHAHRELIARASRALDAGTFIHPVVGETKPGDVAPEIRVRCYRALMPSFDSARTALGVLPLAMRMAGPREAVWHAIIRRNFGCTHFIVGRDHAGPGSDRSGRPFYEPYAAQEALAQHQAELGIEMIPFEQLVYSPSRRHFIAKSEAAPEEKTEDISGTQLRETLEKGGELPAWFTPPDVANVLKASFPPKSSRGLVIFLTGLPSSGKSTIANGLADALREHDSRSVSVLDGDVVRSHLSAGLGFSKADRDTNIRRIGFVASEIARARGIAICAAIAPYDAVRQEVERMVRAAGGEFVLLHVSTPVDVCEARDAKGLYAKARRGEVKEFTGVSDPYEIPQRPDIRVDTHVTQPVVVIAEVMEFLRNAQLASRSPV